MQRFSFALLALLVAAVLVGEAAARPPSPAVRAQRAHARDVTLQIDRIGRNLEQTIQEYDGARLRLARVTASLHDNEIALRVARVNLHAAQQRLAARLVSLYVNGQPSALDVLAGAKSLTDVIDRLESTKVLSRQDAAIGEQTFRFKHAVQRREALLERQKRARADTVRRLASQKRTIEAALARQQRLLASIHRTIRDIQAREAAAARRQAELAREQLAREIAARAAAERQAAVQPTPEPGLVPSPVSGTTAGGGHAAAAQIALQYLGIPYVWGGASPSGFDCSGLVLYVYAQLGISLPHYTVSQWNATSPVAYSDMQPGDLVFFDGLGHVGIYIGNGQMVDAPHTGSVVRIDSIGSFGGFVGARRVP